MTLPDADYPIDTVETLPWAASGETLLAAGELKIEKVQGSANFIKCGPVNQAILRNSQCWCVDGVSRFVLRVRKLYYYRMEFPIATPDQKAKVEELKEVLKKLLKFEVTPCPFNRDFRVELPSSAITPRRRGTWKRKEGSLPSTPLTEGSRLPRLKSSRTWNRRAVSDTKVANQELGTSRLDSSYAESPLERRAQFDESNENHQRPDTPSSMTSSEALSRSMEFGDGSDIIDGSENEEAETHNSVQSEPEEHSTVAAEDQSPPVVLALPSDEMSVSYMDEQNETILNENISETPQDRQDGNHQDSLGDSAVLSRGADEITSGDIDIQDSSFHETPDTEDEAKGSDFAQPLDGTASSIENSLADQKQTETTDVSSNDPILEAVPDESLGSTYLEPTTLEPAPLELESPEHASLESASLRPELEPLITYEEPAEAERHIEAPLDSSSHNQGLQDEDLRTVSSADSFHTLAEAPEEQHNLPQDQITLLSQNSEVERPNRHRREISELTITAPTPHDGIDAGLDRTSTPLLVPPSASDSSWADVPTPSSSAIQEGLRHRLKSRRSLSPLPPQSTIFAPSSHQPQGDHVTSAILQKACTLALVKPIEVVVLLVHIIARIAGGATFNDLISGELFKRPEPRRRRPSSLPDQVDIRRDDSDEDDFGIPIRTQRTNSVVERPDDETDSLFDLD